MLMFNIDTENENTLPEDENEELIDDMETEAIAHDVKAVSSDAEQDESASEETDESVEEIEEGTAVSEQPEVPAEAPSGPQDNPAPVNAIGYKEPDALEVAVESKSNENQEEKQRVVEEIKKHCASKPMKLFAVGTTISLAMTLVAHLISALGYKSIIDGMQSLYSSLLQTFPAIANAKVSVTMPTLGSAILEVIVFGFEIFALWHIVKQGKKSPGEIFSTAGLTIYHVFVWIVLASIGFFTALFALMIAIMVAFGGSLTSTLPGGIAMAFMVLIFGVFLTIFAFFLVYHIVLVRFVSGCKKTVRTGKLMVNGSAFLGVVSYISFVLGIISAVFLLVFNAALSVFAAFSGVNLGNYSAVLMCLFVAQIGTIIADFGFGTLMFKFKSGIKQLRKELETK